ncbi:hypothetical protein M422DRAFT_238939 [Sphaerobolus stellatus SS14]|nr:hypothetical protein M422DRAFT_238939 [Sphaerobolus stellatus SS14]
MSKPITLYTLGTPNGFPISVALEELGVPYETRIISFKENEQKTEWFLKINPNGRIPAIVDHNNRDFAVFETSAILLYLAQHYDKGRKISYDPVKEPNLHSEELQWLFFTHGGLGPMQGQATHFLRYAPEKIPYAINRYIEESKRLFSVVEKRLEGRQWLVGDHYGLADIKAMPWVSIGSWTGVDLEPFPNIQGWVERCNARPATFAGMGVPSRWNLEEMKAKADTISEDTRKMFGFKKAD